MSYQSQWKLTYDDAFVSRCRDTNGHRTRRRPHARR
jgi:hypothetical protein